MRFWDEVNREDVAIVERVQRGLCEHVYHGGRMCYRFEESVHRFQNLVIDRMLGIGHVPEGDAGARVPCSGATARRSGAASGFTGWTPEHHPSGARSRGGVHQPSV